jgi:hypothetical protein
MPLVFVCANFCCIDANCDKQHHHDLKQRTVLKTILDDSPEVFLLHEDADPRRKFPCKHGLRCFEKDCGFIHGFNHDARKILTKKFNKEWKAITMREKIKKEIEEIGKNGMNKWDE